jgi:hypothetical protein
MTTSNTSTDPNDNDYQRAWERARRQVRRLRGWYIHAFIFFVIVGVAWLRYAFELQHTPRMPLKLTFWWGLAVFIHGVTVWGRFGPFNHEWERRQIDRIMERDQPRG